MPEFEQDRDARLCAAAFFAQSSSGKPPPGCSANTGATQMRVTAAARESMRFMADLGMECENR